MRKNAERRPRMMANKNPALKRRNTGTEREISLCDIVECVTHGKNQNPPFKGGVFMLLVLFFLKHRSEKGKIFFVLIFAHDGVPKIKRA